MEFALVLFVLVVLPLMIVTLGTVTTSIAARYFQLEKEKLEFRKWQAQVGLEQARLLGSLPPWVNPTDPSDLAAWRAAVQETARIGSH